MKNQSSIETDSSEINRRVVLKGVGAMSVVSVLATSVAAGVTQGNPQEDCECLDGFTGKYDFSSGEFVHTEGEDLVTIEDYTNKEGEENEPVAVTYSVPDGYIVTNVCSFGGTDTHNDNDPDGEYESDLTTGGGTRAAISNITFCVEEEEEEEDEEEEKEEEEEDDEEEEKEEEEEEEEEEEDEDDDDEKKADGGDSNAVSSTEVNQQNSNVQQGKATSSSRKKSSSSVSQSQNVGQQNVADVDQTTIASGGDSSGS